MSIPGHRFEFSITASGEVTDKDGKTVDRTIENEENNR